MISWNMSFERELIKQRSLFDLPMSHHDSQSCFSQRLNQRNSSFATADFFNKIGPFRTSGPPSAPIERLYPEGYLCPMQYGAAVQKLHDTGLDRRGSIVREYGCRHDHIAAIAEGD